MMVQDVELNDFKPKRLRFRHLISKSDTLEGISLRYEISLDQLIKLNNAFSRDSLLIKPYIDIPLHHKLKVDDGSVNHAEDYIHGKEAETGAAVGRRLSESSASVKEHVDFDEILDEIDQELESTLEQFNQLYDTNYGYSRGNKFRDQVLEQLWENCDRIKRNSRFLRPEDRSINQNTISGKLNATSQTSSEIVSTSKKVN